MYTHYSNQFKSTIQAIDNKDKHTQKHHQTKQITSCCWFDTSSNKAVYNQWTGLVDWTSAWTTGLIDFHLKTHGESP